MRTPHTVRCPESGYIAAECGCLSCIEEYGDLFDELEDFDEGFWEDENEL